MAIKTVRLAAWLLDQVRKSRRLAEMHIDDDVALALKILRRCAPKMAGPAGGQMEGRRTRLAPASTPFAGSGTGAKTAGRSSMCGRR